MRLLKSILRNGLSLIVLILRSNNRAFAKLVSVLLYIVSPIDILPEALLGPIGLIDDFAVVLLLGGIVKDIVNGIQAQRRAN